MAHVSCGLHLPFFDAQDSAYLGNMCTAPLYRRRGYGTHLLRAAERLTRIASYPVIYLHLRRALPSSSSFHRQFDMYEVGCHGAALCCASPASCHPPPSTLTSGTLLISRIEPSLLCQSDPPAAQMRPSRAAAALNSVPICSTSLADGNHCAGRSFGACRCLTC